MRVKLLLTLCLVIPIIVSSCSSGSTSKPSSQSSSQPSLHIISPKEGDSFSAGAVIPLTWNISSIPDSSNSYIYYHIEGVNEPYWVQTPYRFAINASYIDFTVPDNPGQNLSIAIGLWDWTSLKWIVFTSVNDLMITSK